MFIFPVNEFSTLFYFQMVKAIAKMNEQYQMNCRYTSTVYAMEGNFAFYVFIYFLITDFYVGKKLQFYHMILAVSLLKLQVVCLSKYHHQIH